MRIEPADRAVAPAVNDVDPLSGCMLEHDQWRARQIEFCDCRGDRKIFKRLRAFRYNNGL